MNFAKIKRFDIANGPGIRLSLFVSGCPFHCEGCFNSDTWDYNYGDKYTPSIREKIYEEYKNPRYTGFSLLGGEPIEGRAQEDLIELIVLLFRLKTLRPENPIWIWTGGRYETITNDPIKSQLLSFADVLVDGPFEQEKKDFTLAYCGSSNQRVIDLKKTKEKGEVVLREK